MNKNNVAQVQTSAHSALRWLSTHGGKVSDPTSDVVTQLAKVGAGGNHPNNAERDTHRLVQRMGHRLAADIELRGVRMVNPANLEESVGKLPMILPHQMCLALWERGEQYFRHCLFGDMSDDEVKAFWDHHDGHAEWFSNHPAKDWRARGRIASVGCYGDEVQAYRNSECGVVSVVGWTSEFACRNDPMCRYFAISVWNEHHESSHTYPDAIAHVVQSFKALQNEEWPWSSKGYLVSFSFAQGDLKWLNDRLNVHNYRQNEFCSRCFCKKVAANVLETLPHFTDNPLQFGIRDYSAVNLEELCGPLFQLPLTMDRIQHDVAHSQLLGTGKAINGALTWSKHCFDLCAMRTLTLALQVVTCWVVPVVGFQTQAQH